MNLKPQDIVVLIKLFSYAEGDRPSYAQMASALDMSASEVHSAIKRLAVARLVHSSEFDYRPIPAAVLEFLIHGVKYAFPARRGSVVRGMPTSFAAEPIARLVQAVEGEHPVWPDSNAGARGVALEPLYRSVPAAARKDPLLYERLALIDAIRSGRSRERAIAEAELRKQLTYEGSK